MNPIKAYILGKRKPYTSPAKFLVVSVTLYVIGYLFIPIEELGMLKMNANEKEFVQLFYQNFQRYLNLGLFMLIPFISLFTFFMSYKTYNFAENLVANAYIQGVFNLFGIVLSLLGYALMQWDMKVGTSLSTLSFLILLRNYYFFFNGNKFIRVMKTLAAIFVSFLAIAIYALVLVFILSYVYDIKEGTEINLSN